MISVINYINVTGRKIAFADIEPGMIYYHYKDRTDESWICVEKSTNRIVCVSSNYEKYGNNRYYSYPHSTYYYGGINNKFIK